MLNFIRFQGHFKNIIVNEQMILIKMFYRQKNLSETHKWSIFYLWSKKQLIKHYSYGLISIQSINMLISLAQILQSGESNVSIYNYKRFSLYSIKSIKPRKNQDQQTNLQKILYLSQDISNISSSKHIKINLHQNSIDIKVVYSSVRFSSLNQYVSDWNNNVFDQSQKFAQNIYMQGLAVMFLCILRHWIICIKQINEDYHCSFRQLISHTALLSTNEESKETNQKTYRSIIIPNCTDIGLAIYLDNNCQIAKQFNPLTLIQSNNVLHITQRKYKIHKEITHENQQIQIKDQDRAVILQQAQYSIQFKSSLHQISGNSHQCIKKITKQSQRLILLCIKIISLLLEASKAILTISQSIKIKSIIYILILLLLSDIGQCASPLRCSPNCNNCYPGGFGACNVCNSGFYISRGRCKACSTKIACTSCDGVYCTSCTSGYFIASTSHTCAACSIINNCATCYSIIDIPYCSTCVNGYVVNTTLPLNGCQACTVSLDYCYICPTLTICTQCINNVQYILTSNQTCIKCNERFPFCQYCTPTQCRACVQLMFLNSKKICQCIKGVLVDDICIDVPGCTHAIMKNNKSYCSDCDTSQNYTYNTGTVMCDCPGGQIINKICTTIFGCISLSIVNETQICYMCNITTHFILQGTLCVCDSGYILNKTTYLCNEKCGDGIVISMPCDDGNLEDLDGCSKTCTIQKHFVCYNGSLNSPSMCLSASYNFQLHLIEISKDTDSNRGEFEFKIINFIPYFYSLNLSQVFFMDIKQNHTIASIQLWKNIVTIKVDYDEDLQGLQALLIMNLTADKFLFPYKINYTFAMISQTAPLVIMEYPSTNILNVLSMILLGLCVLVGILVIISAFLHKMIGIETLAVFQICNIAPYLVGDRSIVLRVFDNLTFVNGFGRQFFYNQSDARTYGQNFEDMDLTKSFTQGMVINEIVLLLITALYFLGLGLKSIMSKVSSKRSRILAKMNFIVNIFCRNLHFTITIGLFFAYSLAINCNNFRIYEQTYTGSTYQSTRQFEKINSGINFLEIMLTLGIIALVSCINIFTFSTNQNLLRESNSSLLRAIYQEIYFLFVKFKGYVSLFLLNYLLTFGLLSIFVFVNNTKTLFIFSFLILPFASFVIIYRPYCNKIDNIRVSLGQIIILLLSFGLCFKQYQWLKLMIVPLSFQLYFCILITVLLSILVIITFISLASLFCKRNQMIQRMQLFKQIQENQRMERQRLQQSKEMKFKQLTLNPILQTESRIIKNTHLLKMRDHQFGNIDNRIISLEKSLLRYPTYNSHNSCKLLLD